MWRRYSRRARPLRSRSVFYNFNWWTHLIEAVASSRCRSVDLQCKRWTQHIDAAAATRIFRRDESRRRRGRDADIRRRRVDRSSVRTRNSPKFRRDVQEHARSTLRAKETHLDVWLPRRPSPAPPSPEPAPVSVARCRPGCPLKHSSGAYLNLRQVLRVPKAPR